ncbi:MAG TPA: hypothetical protein PKC58_00590 [Ignavibacteria bacterium]|nr:hypothetical protein [Ignavibacteria bacterium]
MKKKILLAFDDPGGGLAVSSILDTLYKDVNPELIIYAGRLSRRFLNKEEKENFETREIDSFINREDAEKIIRKERPDIIITGTGGGNAEQELRNAAFRNNIKSIVILDFWKDYSRRWKYSEYTVSGMKDIICVMDELTKKEMLDENFKEENIIVTGHPYLDKIFGSYQGIKNADIELSGSLKILFLSQPLEIIGVKSYEIHPLDIFLKAIEHITVKFNNIISVKIKLHPSEKKSDEIINILKKYDKENPDVAFAQEDITLEELIENSDLVAGYNTIALFEAKAAGRRAISLKVADLNNSLSKAMTDAGIEISGPDTESIIKCITEKSNIETDIRKFSGGIRNIVNVVMKELRLN